MNLQGLFLGCKTALLMEKGTHANKSSSDHVFRFVGNNRKVGSIPSVIITSFNRLYIALASTEQWQLLPAGELVLGLQLLRCRDYEAYSLRQGAQSEPLDCRMDQNLKTSSLPPQLHLRCPSPHRRKGIEFRT